MKRIRKLVFVSMLLVLVIAMTGCADVKMDIELNKDAASRITFTSAMFKSVARYDLLPEPMQGLITPDKMKEVGMVVEEIEYVREEDSQELKGKKATIEFSNPLEFFKSIAHEDGFTVKDLGDDIYRVEFKVDPIAYLESVGQRTPNLSKKEELQTLGLHGLRTPFTLKSEYEIVWSNATYQYSNYHHLWFLSDSEYPDGRTIYFEIKLPKEVVTEELIVVEEGNIDEELKGTTEARLAEKGLTREDSEFYGKALKELGILKGTSKGLELDKVLTRAEGVTVYANLLGLGDEIAEFVLTNPDYKTGFDDVPKWAEATINYLHYKGLVSGVSKTQFGSNNTMTEAQFVTLLLRALGYSDANGDFSWDKSVNKAKSAGLFGASFEEYDKALEAGFNRGTVSYMAYNALFFKNKVDGTVLINNLEM